MEKIQSLPNALRTLTGLAHQGYTPQTAVADIVDNSLAAGAENVNVQFVAQPDGSHMVMIADDGCGMDGDTLIRAMQIGSSSELARTNLSVYGMGLKAASMSFSRKFSVISKSENNTPVMASWDLDSQEEDPWTILFGEPNPVNARKFERLVPGNSGTLVIWEKADFRDVLLDSRKIRGARPTGKKAEKVEDMTRDYLSMVFHRFMEGTANGYGAFSITFNSAKLSPFNPVQEEFLSSQWAPIKDDFEIEIEGPNGFELVPYSIKTYLVGQDEEYVPESKMGMRWQGIYPYRYDRLLQSPDWLGVLTFHPDWNAVRVVLELDGRLDGVTKTDMKKSGLSLPPEMLQNIKEKLDEYTRRVRREKNRRNAEKRSKRDTSKLHESSSKTIAASGDFINVPAVSVSENGAKIITQFGESLTDLAEIRGADYGTDARIETTDSLDGGVLFEPRWNGSEAVIFLNKSHPFYQKIYLAVMGQDLAIQGLDYLIYAMCQAELLTRTDRVLDQFRRMRMEMSESLRAFVSELEMPDDSVEKGLDLKESQLDI